MNTSEANAAMAALISGQPSVNEASNPSNAKVDPRPPRVPMSAVSRRLEVKPIPGYHLHWFHENNVPAALEAYYEPVERHEVSLRANSPGITGDAGGNTDMGSGVSLVAGVGEGGQPIRLVLMKLPEEYHREDQLNLEKRNVSIMEAIFGDEAKLGMGGVRQDREELTYVDQERTQALFNRKIRKAKVRKPGRM